jgi:hypothetical protein
MVRQDSHAHSRVQMVRQDSHAHSKTETTDR